MKKLFLLGILLISCLSINAQILWKVSGKGLKKPSYILGTHHMASMDMCNKIAGFNKALENCDEIYGEIQKDEMTQQKSTAAIMKYGLAPQDSMVTKILTQQQSNLVDSILQKYSGQKGLINQFAALKPVIISLSLEVMRNSKAFPDFDPTKVFDLQIQEKAASMGKKTNGLETMDYQMGILFNTPISYQIENLMKTVENDEKMTAMSLKVADYYKQQNLDKILETMEDPEGGSSEEEMNIMIYNRNHDWAKKLASILPTESAFICVGSAHLPGNKGLLQLLRNEGYKVEPMK